MVKNKVENHSDHVAASFTYDDLIALDEDRDAAIQWTTGADFHGSRQPSKGRVSSDQSSHLKRTTESRRNRSRNLTCWNCDSLTHRAMQCPKPLRSDVRERLEGMHQFKGRDNYVRSPASFEKRNVHSEARAEEFDPGMLKMLWLKIKLKITLIMLLPVLRTMT